MISRSLCETQADLNGRQQGGVLHVRAAPRGRAVGGRSVHLAVLLEGGEENARAQGLVVGHGGEGAPEAFSTAALLVGALEWGAGGLSGRREVGRQEVEGGAGGVLRHLC